MMLSLSFGLGTSKKRRGGFDPAIDREPFREALLDDPAWEPLSEATSFEAFVERSVGKVSVVTV